MIVAVEAPKVGSEWGSEEWLICRHSAFNANRILCDTLAKYSEPLKIHFVNFRWFCCYSNPKLWKWFWGLHPWLQMWRSCCKNWPFDINVLFCKLFISLCSQGFLPDDLGGHCKNAGSALNGEQHYVCCKQQISNKRSTTIPPMVRPQTESKTQGSISNLEEAQKLPRRIARDEGDIWFHLWWSLGHLKTWHSFVQN
jgi:hypothetical protein